MVRVSNDWVDSDGITYHEPSLPNEIIVRELAAGRRSEAACETSKPGPVIEGLN